MLLGGASEAGLRTKLLEIYEVNIGMISWMKIETNLYKDRKEAYQNLAY